MHKIRYNSEKIQYVCLLNNFVMPVPPGQVVQTPAEQVAPVQVVPPSQVEQVTPTQVVVPTQVEQVTPTQVVEQLPPVPELEQV